MLTSSIKRKVETSLLNAGIDSSDVAGFDDAFVEGILDCNNIQAMVSNVENYLKMEHNSIQFFVRMNNLAFRSHEESSLHCNLLGGIYLCNVIIIIIIIIIIPLGFFHIFVFQSNCLNKMYLSEYNLSTSQIDQV